MRKRTVALNVFGDYPWEEIPESFSQYATIIDTPENVQRRAEAENSEVLAETNVFAYYPQGDASVLNPNGEIYAVSPLVIESRKRILEGRMEFHNCHEVLCFDAHVIIILGPMVPESDDGFQMIDEQLLAVKLWRGRMLVIKPRVLHALPFPHPHCRVRGMVLLPPGTHERDTFFVNLPKDRAYQPIVPC